MRLASRDMTHGSHVRTRHTEIEGDDHERYELMRDVPNLWTKMTCTTSTYDGTGITSKSWL